MRRILLASAGESVAGGKTAELAEHLRACPRCSRYAERLRRIEGSLVCLGDAGFRDFLSAADLGGMRETPRGARAPAAKIVLGVAGVVIMAALAWLLLPLVDRKARLFEALASEDPERRLLAARALGDYRDDAVAEQLASSLRKEENPACAGEIVVAMARTASPVAWDELEELEATPFGKLEPYIPDIWDRFDVDEQKRIETEIVTKSGTRFLKLMLHRIMKMPDGRGLRLVNLALKMRKEQVIIDFALSAKAMHRDDSGLEEWMARLDQETGQTQWGIVYLARAMRRYEFAETVMEAWKACREIIVSTQASLYFIEMRAERREDWILREVRHIFTNDEMQVKRLHAARILLESGDGEPAEYVLQSLAGEEFITRRLARDALEDCAAREILPGLRRRVEEIRRGNLLPDKEETSLLRIAGDLEHRLEGVGE